MSAVIQNEYTGNNSTTTYSFTFPYLKTSDIKASLDGVATTAFTLPNATTLQFNTAPGSGVKIKIFRQTSVDDLTATFYAGSAIKSEDLNDNFTQNLYKTQEVGARFVSKLGSTMTGDLTMGAGTDIIFEGATDDAHETTLTVADPTADRTITLPNVTGTVVTTGDTGTVARTMIANDAVNGTKIADDSINSEHYVDASIDTQHIANLAVTADKIANQTITAGKIATDGVGGSEIQANAVSSGKIAANAVTTAKIADGAIVAAKIGTNSIDSSKLQTAAVLNNNLADGIVTQAKMADDSVGAAELVDASVGEVALAANSVTNAKMADSAVGTSELVNAAVTTDKIADNAVTMAKLAGGTLPSDIAVVSANITDGTIATADIADNAVTTGKIQDGELKTLAGMQSGTASKLASGQTLTADINDLNQIDGLTKQTTISDSDASFPTSGAVVDYVAAQLAPIGGFEAIANEQSFPNTQPQSGVVISIADAGGLAVSSTGTASGQTVGGTTVNISGIATNFRGSSIAAGIRLLVASTGSGQNYTYHKATLKEDDLVSLSGDINDFNERYRVGSQNPTSSLDSGDLFFNTSTGKLLVYNGTNSAWEEAQSIGNFFISTLSPAFDGSTQNFTITNAPTNAQQIILSINGVVQKPNAGTSTPSEGFALSGSTVKLSAAPAAGDSYHAVVLGSTVNIGTPSNNTVSTAIIQNGAVTTDKIADDAVTSAKIADGNVDTNHLADNAVRTNKINDANVTQAKIADGAISTAKLLDAGVSGNTGITAAKLADSAVTTAKIAANAVTNPKIVSGAIDTGHIADQAVTLAKLPHGTSSNDGKFLRANNGGDPTFESVPAGITINNQADNRIITATGTTDTLNAESNVIIDANGKLGVGTASPDNELQVQKANAGGDVALRVTNATGTDAGTTASLYLTTSPVTDFNTTYLQAKRADGSFNIGYGTDTPHLTILGPTGNVGLGTTTPVPSATSYNGATLHIHQTNSSSAGSQIHLTTGASGQNAGSGSILAQWSDNNLYINNRENGNIQFYVNGGSRARIDSDGLKFGTDTASANALDDYEEGTWTPDLTRWTGSAWWSNTWDTAPTHNIGLYRKVGNVVYITFDIGGFDVASSTDGRYVGMNGLPFAATSTSGNAGHLVVTYSSSTFETDTATSFWISNGGTTTTSNRFGDDNGSHNTYQSGSNKRLRGQGFYFTS